MFESPSIYWCLGDFCLERRKQVKIKRFKELKMNNFCIKLHNHLTIYILLKRMRKKGISYGTYQSDGNYSLSRRDGFPRQKKMANRIFQRLTIISLFTRAGRQALLRRRTQESADQSQQVQEIHSELPESLQPRPECRWQ